MLAVTAPFTPDRKAPAPPTPRERQLTWAAIFVSLALFWYAAGVAVTALWSAWAG